MCMTVCMNVHMKSCHACYWLCHWGQLSMEYRFNDPSSSRSIQTASLWTKLLPPSPSLPASTSPSSNPKLLKKSSIIPTEVVDLSVVPLRTELLPPSERWCVWGLMVLASGNITNCFFDPMRANMQTSVHEFSSFPKYIRLLQSFSWSSMLQSLNSSRSQERLSSRELWKKLKCWFLYRFTVSENIVNLSSNEFVNKRTAMEPLCACST